MKKITIVIALVLFMVLTGASSVCALRMEDISIKSDKLTYEDYELSKQKFVDYYNYMRGLPLYDLQAYLKRDHFEVLNKTSFIPGFEAEKFILNLAVEGICLCRLAKSYKNPCYTAVLKKKGEVKFSFGVASILCRMEFGLFDLLGNGVLYYVWIFNLEPDFRTVYNSDDQGFSMEDLNKDGVYEIVKGKNFFLSSMCKIEYIGKPVIFEYNRGQKKYVCANEKFQWYILRNTQNIFTPVKWIKHGRFLTKNIN
ncbi:MAG: hypothetical protein ABIH00_03905 [Armatimonadota bacterium]